MIAQRLSNSVTGLVDVGDADSHQNSQRKLDRPPLLNLNLKPCTLTAITKEAQKIWKFRREAEKGQQPHWCYSWDFD